MKVSNSVIATIASQVLALPVNGIPTFSQVPEVVAVARATTQSSTPAPPLRDQVTALDAAGLINWQEVEGGGRAAVLSSQFSAVQQRDDVYHDFPAPAKFLSNVWNSLHADVEVENYHGRALCPGGGSHMSKALVDSSANFACNYFVKQSVIGQLGLQVWHAYETKDNQATSDGPGFVRWLMGSVSNNPVPLTEEFCSDLWDAVKSMCTTKGTTADTQGQAVSAGDWVLYADPTSNKHNT